MSRLACQSRDSQEVAGLLAVAAQGIPHRRPELFFEFLRQGYDLVRLDRADPRHYESALLAKLSLGSLITAIDDLADDPRRVDVRALERATTLVLSPGELFAPESEFETMLLILRDRLRREIASLPGHALLAKLFAFDLAQIVHANAYHHLLTTFPAMGNATEMRQYGPYNMGMIAAHLIDLMTIPAYDASCLGADREAFHWGQRHGRISNMIATRDREIRDGDVTSELLHPAVGGSSDRLRAEQEEILVRLAGHRGTSFDVRIYSRGLADLQRLHERLRDRI